MDKLKNKLLNYSVQPPVDAWGNISRQLDGNRQTLFPTSKNISRYFLPLAAAVLAIVLCAVFFINKTHSPIEISKADSGKQERNIVLFSAPDTNLLSFKEIDESANAVSSKNIKGGYITIASVDGKPVKVSSKAATLIVSSNDQYPPKAIWSSKVNKWKARMLSNPVTPTTANFLDIADLTEALDEKNNPGN